MQVLGTSVELLWKLIWKSFHRNSVKLFQWKFRKLCSDNRSSVEVLIFFLKGIIAGSRNFCGTFVEVDLEVIPQKFCQAISVEVP